MWQTKNRKPGNEKGILNDQKLTGKGKIILYNWSV